MFITAVHVEYMHVARSGFCSGAVDVGFLAYYDINEYYRRLRDKFRQQCVKTTVLTRSSSLIIDPNSHSRVPGAAYPREKSSESTATISVLLRSMTTYSSEASF